jgi:hypothetical protein
MVFPTIMPANSVSGGYEIDNSLRFNDGDSPKLAITPGGAGDRDTFTFSFWIKRTTLGAAQRIFSAGTSIGTNNNNVSSFLFESNDTLKFFGEVGGSASFTLQTNRLFRDPSAWYHIVVAVDTEDGTAANRIKLYVNGVQETSFSTANYMNQNTDTFFNAANVHNISYTGGGYIDGYLAEFHHIDGTQVAPTEFGEVDDNGVWIPKAYDGSYGTNGFYLDFSNDATKHAIAVVGNAKHSTTQNKIGATSISFDGNGDRLDIPASTLMETASGTIECWVYMNALADGSQLYYNPPIYNKGGVYQALTVRANGKVTSHLYTGSVNELISANAISTGEWVHLAVTWNDAGRKIWINGVLNGTSSTSLTAMDAGGNNATFHIGEGTSDSHTGLNAYVDELRVSKTDRYTSNFTPYTAALTEDSNTTLLIHSDTDNNSTTFTDSSGVIGGPGNDQTGNENHFTPVSIAATDVTTDTPTNNFATMNPLLTDTTTVAFSEGNLKTVCTNASTAGSSIAVQNGKWYVEMICTAKTATNAIIGICTVDGFDGQKQIDESDNGGSGHGYVTNATKLSGGASYGATWAVDDIMAVALDLDTAQNTVTFYKNNASQGAIDIDNALYVFGSGNGQGSSTVTMNTNFGADDTFAGEITSAGNTDANGYGLFKYAPPSGYYSLCTKNLAEFG